MLKQTLILALALALAAAAVAVNRPCDQGDDCAHDECCLSNYQPDGRRDVRATGTCQKLGLEKQSCITKLIDTPVAGGKPSSVVLSCPCSPGFSCLATQDSPFIVPIGRQGVCIRDQKPLTPSPCNNGVDCADDECCVSRFQPDGRRALSAISAFDAGYCQKMKNANEGGCLVSQAGGKPSGMVFSCPCRKGLTCAPGDQPMFIMPFGQVGTCQ